MRRFERHERDSGRVGNIIRGEYIETLRVCVLLSCDPKASFIKAGHDKKRYNILQFINIVDLCKTYGNFSCLTHFNLDYKDIIILYYRAYLFL